MTHSEVQREYDRHIARSKDTFKHALTKHQLEEFIRKLMGNRTQEEMKFISRVISDSLDFTFENGWAQGKAAYRQ